MTRNTKIKKYTETRENGKLVEMRNSSTLKYYPEDVKPTRSQAGQTVAMTGRAGPGSNQDRTRAGLQRPVQARARLQRQVQGQGQATETGTGPGWPGYGVLGAWFG